MVASYLRLVKFNILLCLLLPAIDRYCSTLKLELNLGLITGALLILSGIIWGIFEKLKGKIESTSETQANFLDTLPDKYTKIAIFGSAALSLFLELVIIRWQSSEFPIFAFYKNFALLACFAGLGLGYALANRKRIPLSLTIPLIAWQMLWMLGLKFGIENWTKSNIFVIPFSEQLHMGLGEAATYARKVAVYCFLITVFLLTTVIFIPVGQLCGRLMKRKENLPAYGLNLLGSLCGILLSFVVSYLWTPPIIWFALCFLGLILFQVYERNLLLFSGIASLLAIIILAWPVSTGKERIFSPYQMLEREGGTNGWMQIRAAGHYFQKVYNLSYEHQKAFPELGSTANYYELPYTIFDEKPEHVAIVGAGTGNDVAAALRKQAGHIDAIEIDPVIIKLGKQYHPERPYHNEKVSAIVNDARTFLRSTSQNYDIIVYGLLDSHSLLSHSSSVRLDSFVYTVEGFTEARSKLKENGMVSLSFAILSPELGRKIYLMMEKAFDGNPPVCIQSDYDLAVTFMQNKKGNLKISSELLQKTGFNNATVFYGNSALEADISTDDWPFFYMPKRIYPVSYLFILGLILLLSFLVNLNFFREKPGFNHPAFFFLGAGFMLIETKGITELGLAFGNTWQVIGIVISGILLMAFLANCFVQWFHIKKPHVPFAFLIISLAIGFFIAKTGGLGSDLAGKIGTIFLLTCPMFFSGMVFSTLLSTTEDIAGVMAINLMGAMFGGLLEYNSMYFGFQFLYIIAIVLYLLAIVSSYLIRPKS